MIKKTLALALSVMMLGAVVVGCGGGSSDSGNTTSPAATTGDTPTTSAGGDETPVTTDEGNAPSGSVDNVMPVTMYTNPETCDPQKNSSVDGAIYMCHLYEGLMRYKWDGSGVEYGLAESHEVSDDGLVWTFTLRDGVKWSDGSDITAADFEYTFKRLVDPETEAPYGIDMGGYLKNGVAVAEGEMEVGELGVKAIDEKTVEVTLENPTPYFEEIMAFPVFYIVKKDVVEADPAKWWTNENAVTSGAFKVKSFTSEQNMEVVPNENYWDAGSVVAKTINFMFMAPEAATAAIRTGDVVYGDRALAEEADALKAAGLYEVRPQLGTYYLSFNCQEEPFNNPLVRKAFYYAIDSKYISETVINGMYSPMTAIIPEGFNGEGGSDFRSSGNVYKDINNMEENIKIAQEALAEAGYPNGEGFPSIEYLYNSDPLHANIAQAMQNQWKEALGVEVKLGEQEWDTFLDARRKQNFIIARDGWVSDYNDASSMLTLFTTSSGNNNGKYSSEKFDEAIANAGKLPEANEEYYKYLHEAEDILIGEDYGVAPLLQYNSAMLVSPDLKDWGYTPLGYKFLHKAYLASW